MVSTETVRTGNRRYARPRVLGPARSVAQFRRIANEREKRTSQQTDTTHLVSQRELKSPYRHISLS